MAASTENASTILPTRCHIQFSVHASGKNSRAIIELVGSSSRVSKTSSRVSRLLIYALLPTIGIELDVRLAGSVIMSAAYSYEAVRRDDHMVEGAAKAVQIITTELRPEVAAVFSIFPSRNICYS
jgi:hypothetical protein